MEFDCLAIDVNGTNLKVDSYRAEVTFRIRVLGEPQEQTRLNLKTLSSTDTLVVWEAHLSYSRVANEEELKEVIVVVGHLLSRNLVVFVE